MDRQKCRVGEIWTGHYKTNERGEKIPECIPARSGVTDEERKQMREERNNKPPVPKPKPGATASIEEQAHKRRINNG